MTLLLIYITVALVFSFLCSILEVVLLSITPSALAHIGQDNPKVGQRMQALKAHIDRPLAAILSLNTIVHTVGAAGVGAQTQSLWGANALTIAAVLFTLLVLVISEIIPKTLGTLYWRQLTGVTSLILPPLILLLSPFVWMSEQITRMLKKHTHTQQETISREEFAALARVGGEQGIFDESEIRIMRNLLCLSSLSTRDIMTPRTVMFCYEENMTVKQALDQCEEMVFSRVPIYKNESDQITGYVLKDQLLLNAARGNFDTSMRHIAREAHMVPDTLAVPTLFKQLLNKREHIAIVIDEHGGVDGVVTMEDVLETLLGLEIVDEMDPVKDMRAMARIQWEARAKRIGKTSDILGGDSIQQNL